MVILVLFCLRGLLCNHFIVSDSGYWVWLQRLSNLRIHENFNENLCRAVAKACVRVGAIDFGMLMFSVLHIYNDLCTCGYFVFENTAR